jgi:hypothetical protein
MKSPPIQSIWCSPYHMHSNSAILALALFGLRVETNDTLGLEKHIVETIVVKEIVKVLIAL